MVLAQYFSHLYFLLEQFDLLFALVDLEDESIQRLEFEILIWAVHFGVKILQLLSFALGIISLSTLLVGVVVDEEHVAAFSGLDILEDCEGAIDDSPDGEGGEVKLLK
jgi:hypothetical protein